MLCLAEKLADAAALVVDVNIYEVGVDGIRQRRTAWEGISRGDCGEREIARGDTCSLRRKTDKIGWKINEADSTRM